MTAFGLHLWEGTTMLLHVTDGLLYEKSSNYELSMASILSLAAAAIILPYSDTTISPPNLISVDLSWLPVGNRPSSPIRRERLPHESIDSSPQSLSNTPSRAHFQSLASSSSPH